MLTLSEPLLGPRPSWRGTLPAILLIWQLLTQPWGKHSPSLVPRGAQDPPACHTWLGRGLQGEELALKTLSLKGRSTLGWDLLAGELRALGEEDPSCPQGWTVGHLVALCKPKPQMHIEEFWSLEPPGFPACRVPTQDSVDRSSPRPGEAPPLTPAWTEEETLPATLPQLRQNPSLQSPGLTLWKTPA